MKIEKMSESGDEISKKINQTIFNNSLMESVLADLANLVDAKLCQIVAVDLKQNAMSYSLIGSNQLSEELRVGELAYLQFPYEQDPRWSGMLTANTGEWRQCHSLVTDDFVRTSKLYQEILIPFGTRYTAGVKLLQDEDVVVLFVVMTSEKRKPLSENDIAQLNYYIPQIMQVVTLQKQLYLFSTAALVGYSLINQLPQPVVLLNLAKKVMHTNTAAQQLTKLTHLINIDNGYLQLENGFQAEFEKHCNELELKFRLQYDSMVDNRACFKVTDNKQNETLYIFSNTLMPEKTMCSFGVRPLIILTFYHPSFALAVDMQLLSSAFGLTPMECRVALALMDGLVIKEIALKHDVKVDTVKKQIQSIYDKTATHRQCDLVKLLLSFPRQDTTMLLS